MDIDTKVVVVGDSGAGKTSFIERLMNDYFRCDPDSTIGAAVKTYRINGNKFIFWDTAGQERFRSIIPLYYKSCHCVFVFYDMSDFDKHAGIPFWLKSIHEEVPDGVPVVIIGCKSDKPSAKEINYDDKSLKAAMGKLNVIAKAVSSSKIESREELLAKFTDIFNKVYEFSKDHQGIRRQTIKIYQKGYMESLKENTSYYTGGYCNIL